MIDAFVPRLHSFCREMNVSKRQFIETTVNLALVEAGKRGGYLLQNVIFKSGVGDTKTKDKYFKDFLRTSLSTYQIENISFRFLKSSLLFFNTLIFPEANIDFMLGKDCFYRLVLGYPSNLVTEKDKDIHTYQIVNTITGREKGVIYTYVCNNFNLEQKEIQAKLKEYNRYLVKYFPTYEVVFKEEVGVYNDEEHRFYKKLKREIKNKNEPLNKYESSG